MARRERPWYWWQRRCWYVTLNGRRHRLGGDKDAAFERWHRLCAGTESGSAADSDAVSGGVGWGADRDATDSRPAPHLVGGVRCGDLVEAYLAAHAGWAGPHCRRAVASHLRLFVRTPVGGPPKRSLRRRAAASLTAADFEAVAAARRWGATTRTAAKRRWAACCNWALRQTPPLLTANPLRGLGTGRDERRRRLVVPTPEQTRRLLATASEPLRAVIVAVRDSGCRPSEVFRVTAAECVGDRWLLPTSKGGGGRTVFLTERLRQLCDDLRRRHPTGPLFRRRSGKPWPLYSCQPQCEFRRLRRRCGLPAGLSLYSFRHAFATDALARGLDAAVVAELMGNSVAVLLRHYTHLRERAD